LLFLHPARGGAAVLSFEFCGLLVGPEAEKSETARPEIN
jgi:hypothetical protein